ncbi:MAG: hypothetical protein HY927_16975 [Elusimicrobia bacterium]|nr:hypothetical protein [Elusimicrobiota bacterium]
MDLYLAKGPADGRRAALPRGARFLCFDWEALSSLRGLGADAVPWEDCFPEERADETVARAERACLEWHRRGGRDFTEFEGVSLGKAYRWYLYAVGVQPAYKFLVALLEACLLHKPDVVYCDTSVPMLHREILSSVQAQARSFRIEWVHRPSCDSSVSVWSLPPIAMPRSKLLACRAINRLAGLLAPAADDRPTILLSYYHSLDAVFARMGDPAFPFRCLVADTPHRKHLPRLLLNGAKIVLDHRTAPSPAPPMAEALAAMRRDWSDAKEDPEGRAVFTWEGIPLRHLFEPQLDRFFQSDIQGLAWACSRLNELWRTEAPSVVLMPFDDPPLQHLLSDIARRHKTPCVILLHGMTEIYRLPFGRTNSSHWVLWGAEQAELFERTGSLQDSAVLTLGSAGLDRLARTGKAPAAPGGPKLNILVLTHPSKLWASMVDSQLATELHAVSLMEALSKVEGIEITLKLHPCESLPYYLRLLKGHPAVSVVKDRPLDDCLAACDLVIGAYSTVLMEALVMGKPVINVQFCRSTSPAPFDGRSGIPLLRTKREVEEAVRNVVASPADALKAIREPYPAIIERFAGSLDGGATDRLLSTLAELAAARRV